MRPLKHRELRQPASVPARLRSDAGWTDVTIANVSSRGMMLRCVSPPPRRSYIEVRHAGVCIVGRVVWQEGTRCGVHTQARVDVDDLLSNSPRGPLVRSDDFRRAMRAGPARRATLSADELARQSRQRARRFEFALVVMTAACGAAVIAMTVLDTLVAPMDRVAHTLAGSGGARG